MNPSQFHNSQVVERGLIKYCFAEGPSISRFATPWFNRSELASFRIKAWGCKNGKYFSLCETVFD